MPQILRRGTHGFTSLPKEGVVRIFPPLKIRRLRPGLNPRHWVPAASTEAAFVCSHLTLNASFSNWKWFEYLNKLLGFKQTVQCEKDD
jgi:hypothetical protein